MDYRGATGCLVHITGGPDLSLKEADEIASSLTYELSPHANVIWGARIEEEYEGMVRVMAVMTGVESAQILGQDAHMERVPIHTGRIKETGNPIEVGYNTPRSIIDQIR